MVESEVHIEGITRFRVMFRRGFYETVKNGILGENSSGRDKFFYLHKRLFSIIISDEKRSTTRELPYGAKE